MRKWTVGFAFVLVSSVFVVTGCGESPTGPGPIDRIQPPPPPPPPTVSSVVVEGAASVEAGETSQLRAIVHRSDGTTQDVSSQATWLSSNPTVATVSGTGFVTAVGLGNADISAAFAGSTGRRTLIVAAARWDIQIRLTSLVVLESCDDFTQGLTNAELAYKISYVEPSGRETVLRDTGYPGSPDGDNLRGAERINAGSVVNLGTSRTARLPGENGQFLRLEFRATEWDTQIVLIPPSTRWVRDSDMNGRLGTATHSFANGGWSGLGNRSITLGASGCRVRLDYSVDATRVP
jgi:hypothetical protein